MTSGGSVAEEHTIQWCGTVGCIRVSMLQPADSSQQQLCVAFAERKPHGNASSCEELPAESRRRVPQFWITFSVMCGCAADGNYRNSKRWKFPIIVCLEASLGMCVWYIYLYSCVKLIFSLSWSLEKMYFTHCPVIAYIHNFSLFLSLFVFKFPILSSILFPARRFIYFSFSVFISIFMFSNW